MQITMNSVDRRMFDACIGSTEPYSCVIQAIQHHIAAGGGRVRAQFSLDASLRLGIPSEDGITVAAICELLHNASLIHDDLLDRAPLRRGVPTVWAAFDDAIAVCAGDLLLSSAFALLGELTSVEFLAKALSLVHRRTRDVILGQGLEQVCSPDSLESYELVAIGKSASLLSLPFELPLLLSGNEQSLATVQFASQAFAVAYQMLDDLADYDEDIRKGSVNAVAVALAAGSPDFRSSCALVSSRAQELIHISIKYATELPMECGSTMIAYAEGMRSKLLTGPTSTSRQFELSRHGS